MTDLQAILQVIDELPAEAIEQVRWRIDKRDAALQHAAHGDDAEAWIADLHDAIEAFREGLSDNELHDIVNSMNIGYISPKELYTLEQFAGPWPEDETL